MSSRKQILAALKANQPPPSELPVVTPFEQPEKDLVKKFSEMLTFIGGNVNEVTSYQEIVSYIKMNFNEGRIVSTLSELKSIAVMDINGQHPHALEDVKLTILKSEIAVAENGAVWISDDQLRERVLPFITEYLAVVINKTSIVPTLAEAYQKIGPADYGFGVFIAGPSKTSDIEQSLVLGAHGPKGMTVFLM